MRSSPKIALIVVVVEGVVVGVCVWGEVNPKGGKYVCSGSGWR